MKILILILIAMCACFCAKAQTDTSKSAGWQYYNKIDEITSGKSFYAKIASPDSQFSPELLIRNSHNKNEVLLTISKGVFNHKIDGSDIVAKFDDGKVEKFKGWRANNGSFDVIFITPNSKFIKEAMKSKKILIQTQLYNKPPQTFHFITSGLKWDHL